MNKPEIIESIASKAELSKKDAESALNAFMDTVEENLAKGEKISLVGFMNFEAKDVPERTGRNPKTSETILIPAHKKVSVKVGKALKDAVNA